MASGELLKEQLPKQLNRWDFGNSKLWYDGDLSLLETSLVSIVGTRNPTTEGLLIAQQAVDTLVEEGFTILSGLAAGIDTICHKRALEINGNTVAVMGTPINECYPKENAALREEIIREGLLLSQFRPGERTQRHNFPKRNELMSLLSDFTYIVEASEKSGTRHQVTASLKNRRRVAFSQDLAEQGYKWVEAAIQSGLGCVIHTVDDLLVLAKTIPFPEDRVEK